MRMTTIALALTCTACSTTAEDSSTDGKTDSGGQPQNKTIKYPEYLAEYKSSIKSLSFPRGYKAPTKPRHDDGRAEYEVGSGEGDATDFYLCAWGSEYLKQRAAQNEEAARKALDMWAGIQKLPAWKRAYSDPHTQTTLLSSVKEARLGAPTTLSQLIKANC